MTEFIQVMTLPLLACLILTGIHAYLGFHVIERQVIFVDLALAQMAALGAALALFLGFPVEGVQSYFLSLGLTVLGAAVFSFFRLQTYRIPQEAFIGIAYALSAALLVLVLSRTGEGDEHIRQSLVGNILLVNHQDVIKMFVVYSFIGLVHYLFRKQFILLSNDRQDAQKKGLNVRGWDFLFYASFGIVVTSSVQIAGVLMVFAFLIIPPVSAMLFAKSLKSRLILGWLIGLLASSLGLIFSYYGDFPTGASIVCVFGIILLILIMIKWIIMKSKIL
jgi:zinc/manganese transport system permease protein